VEITFVPNHVLKKQDCVAVVEVHVLACFNLLWTTSRKFPPRSKIPNRKKFSHSKTFCSPQVKAHARSPALRTTPAWRWPRTGHWPPAERSAVGPSGRPSPEVSAESQSQVSREPGSPGGRRFLSTSNLQSVARGGVSLGAQRRGALLLLLLLSTMPDQNRN